MIININDNEYLEQKSAQNNNNIFDFADLIFVFRIEWNTL